MLTLNDGRSELWQWDTGRTLTVDADCSQVHFSNKVFGRSIDVDVVDGVAIVPDILLQTDKELIAWAFVGTSENGYTKISKVFKVNRRNKPADYVFTPPEQTTLAEIMERLEDLEAIQDPDAIKNAVEDYLEQNPVEVPVQSVNGHTGEVKLTAGDVGAISQDDLQEATNEALAQAKASGEFDGQQGQKGDPGEKGDKGDTGEKGADGKDGQPGKDGVDAVVDSTLTQSGQAADAAEVGNKINELNGDIAALSGDFDNFSNVATSYRGIQKPINLLIPDTMKHGYAINEYGSVFANEGTSVSDFMSVEVGKTYNYYDSFFKIANASKVVFFDKDKNVLSVKDNTSNIVIPENCKYVRIMVLKAYWNDVNMFCDQKPLVYSEYHEPYLSDFPYAQRFAYMPRLFFYGSVDAMSKDNSVTLEFEYIGSKNYAYTENENGVKHRGFASVKWQGSSSQAYEKKNYTIKLYEDAECETPLNIEFRASWGSHNKYVLKANHIDATHARNIVCAKLWGGTVNSRTSDNEYLTKLKSLVNGGAIDGYPVLVFINDEYKGLYTLNIPKDAYMFNMNGEGKEAILCGESHENGTRFKAESLLDESDWTIEYKSDSFTDVEILTSFNKIQSACALQGDEFKTAIEQVCDVNSVIDYIIFLLMFHMPDNYDKNMIMATYDGNYWFASMYDMDTSFGNNWDGTAFYDASANINVADSFVFYNQLLERVYQNYYDELKARYNQLVTSTLSVGNVASVINNFVVKVPRPVYNQEPMLYPSIPNSSIGANDLVMFYHLRSAMVEKTI